MSRAAEPCILPLTWGKGAAERPVPHSIIGAYFVGEIIYALRANKLRELAASAPAPKSSPEIVDAEIHEKNEI